MENTRENGYKYLATLSDVARLTKDHPDALRREFDPHSLVFLGRDNYGIPPTRVRKFLADKGVDYAFRAIANINLRGGIGKTTVSITTATRAAQYGFKTCILDMDSQGSATLAFGVTPERDDPIFYDVWQNPEEMVMGSIRKIGESLYLLPSSLENGLLDSALTNPAAQKSAVRNVCEVLRSHGFDLVIIDCPPSLGAAVISSICAAETVIIPVASDPFSIRGLELTMGEIKSITDTFGLKTPRIQVVFSRFDRREKMSFEALEALKNGFAEYLSPVIIRTSTDYAKALSRRETIFASHLKSPAKEDYDMFVRGLLGLGTGELNEGTENGEGN